MHTEEKIVKSNVKDIFELNMAQKGMLFHYLDDNDQNLYNIQLSFIIRGLLNIEILKTAIQVVQSNNEVLRSVFEWEKTNKPLQIILKETKIEFDFQDLTINFDENKSFKIDNFIREDRNRKFDLKRVPIRISVLKVSNDEFILNITHHHILYDGWSTGIFLKDLFLSYYGIQHDLVDNEIRKPNYRSILLKAQEKENQKLSIDYWKKYLNGYSIKPIQGYKYQHLNDGIEENIKEVHAQIPIAKIDELVTRYKVTRAAIIYAAYGVLLKRYLDCDDVIFGTPISNRDSAISGMDKIMGNFINTIPMRIANSDEMSIAEFIKKVNDELIIRNQHSDTSYNEIKEILDLNPKESLFDSIMVIENYPIDLEAINKNKEFDIQLRSTYGDTGIPIVIHVFFRETLDIELIYQTKLIDKDFINAFIKHLKRIILEISESSGQNKITSLDYILPEEKQELLFDFNNRITESRDEKTILNLFEEQVLMTPDATAVVCDDVAFSYKELDQLSNELGNQLIAEYQITTEDLVGICLDRSEFVIISILGILKSGAAYVPIDPEYPSARKENIISDAGIKLLISEMYYIFDMDYYEGPKFAVDVEFEKGKYSNAPIKNKVSGENLAYIIYTSGSTGNPKGVMIEHKALKNYILWGKNQYVGDQRGNFPLYTSISFDLTITSIFTPLITGNTIIVYKEVGKEQVITKIVLDEKSDIIKLTPSHLKIIRESDFSMIKDFSRHKKIIVGGEKLETSLAKEIFEKFKGNIKIYNEYGPTEATVGCMIHEFDINDNGLSVPIGAPIDNTHIYILDKQLRPVAKNIPGELYIAGNGLARGYINKKDLTEERFVNNPFLENQLMYKTGDTAIKFQNGKIEFIGRQDNQVKIRGFRIELGEIENVLLSHDEVLEAVVIIKERNDDQFLLCYYISGNEIDNSVLKRFLEERLPFYMVPSQFIHLESIPLTINGKLDRKALPDPNTLERLSDAYKAPETELEKKLETLWKDILGVSKIGIKDDFFVLGGHSLSATRLASKIKKELSVEISINALFEYSTIEEQADFIEKQEKSVVPHVTQIKNKPELVPLSFAQERLWFIDQFEGTQHYHMPLILELDKGFNFELFKEAIGILVNRHESLRTVLKTHNGEPYQCVLPENQWQIDTEENISGLSENEVNELIQRDVQTPFDLSKDHKIRIKILKGDAGYEKIIIVIHHIAFDGWSIPILKNELSLIYKSLLQGTKSSLKKLSIQYSDYSIWQNEYLSGNVLKEGIDYWVNKLSNTQPLQIPTDFSSPKNNSYQGANYKFWMDESISKSLTTISQNQSVSLFMTLLSTIKILLSKYSGQSDICIGTPVANREQVEVEQLIGFFVNTLALRTQIDHDQTFSELLQIVKTTTLEAQAYQQIPFEKVIDSVITKRDLSRSPLFQVMFILQNEEESLQIELGDATLLPVEWHNGRTAKFELTFDVTKKSDGIEFIINYRTDLFREETIKRLSENFQNLIHSIVNNPLEKIGELKITSDSEDAILEKFNETKVDYPDRCTTILDLFKEQVLSKPNTTAIIYEGKHLSFKELDEISNQLSNLLISKGVEEQAMIPICVDRSFEMIIGILAILKLGGAYVPIDPYYPQDRIDFILSDVNTKFILTQTKYRDLFGNQSISIDDKELYQKESNSAPNISVDEDWLAYVIYTSGTTGKPKGVMNQHSGILNRLLWMRDYLEISDEDRILQKTTFCFDVSVWELLLPLITGAKLVFAKPEGHKDVTYLQSLIKKEEISIMHFVPSMLSVFLIDVNTTNCSSLRKVICSGEELKSSSVKDFMVKLQDVELHNLYGPTEAAIDVTAINLTNTYNQYNLIPIGKPIANTQIYIVDKHFNLLPIGIPGELLIGGVQVAKGYLNRQELTGQKFISNPFDDMDPYNLYRSGDLARWLPDGNIEFLGRIDTQVKIRGHRIELGEIEVALEADETIKQAAVIKRENHNGNHILSAYVVSDATDFEGTLILKKLGTKLPEYMIPSTITKLDEIPLNHNGKLDRKKLPEPNVSSLIGAKYVGPRDAQETKIVSIWQELLGVDKIGVYDNFFELGGHSLLATRVLSAINKEFSVNISVQRFFQLGNVDELCKYIRVISSINKKEEAANTIEL